MKNSRINKLPISIILCIILIFITIIIIYHSSYKSTFKRRRSVPSIYYTGDIYSIYGSVGNPYTLYGPPQIQHDSYNSYNSPKLYNSPNIDMLLYGQNSPNVMN